jgi:hypothetical protein
MVGFPGNTGLNPMAVVPFVTPNYYGGVVNCVDLDPEKTHRHLMELSVMTGMTGSC